MPRRFSFRLEPVLNYRRVVEDTKKKEFALVKKDIVEQNKKITFLLREEDKVKMEIKEMEKGEIDVVKVRHYISYLNTLNNNIMREIGVLTKLNEKEVAKRRELSEATKGVKVIERIKERRYSEYMYEVGREERKVLDEVGQNMFTQPSSTFIGI